eukprot:363842-Chlamydomonas_euryale.AAC.8
MLGGCLPRGIVRAPQGVQFRVGLRAASCGLWVAGKGFAGCRLRVAMQGLQAVGSRVAGCRLRVASNPRPPLQRACLRRTFRAPAVKVHAA